MSKLSYLFGICALVTLTNCGPIESCGGDDDGRPWGWRGHRDTLTFAAAFDTIKFRFNEYSFDSSTIRILHDPTLSDEIRFEMDLMTYTNSYHISNTNPTPLWIGDTLWVSLMYSALGIVPPSSDPVVSSKKRARQDPQCTPASEDTKLIAANVFVPLNKRAILVIP